jgi:hypothetical protein
MNNRTSKARRAGRVAAMLGLTGILLATAGGATRAQSGGSQADLIGVWIVQVTLRDCQSKTPLGAPFTSLVTFHAGGTLSEAPSSLGFAAGQRTPGQGIWTRGDGHAYRQQIMALVLFDTPANLPGSATFKPGLPVSPGLFAGWQTIEQTITFTDADHLSSTGTTEFYKADRTQYRTGCATSVGQRFK